MRFQPQKPHLTEFIRSHKKRFLRILALLATFAVGLIASWFILKVALNTEYPMLPVSSNNMCTVQPSCDGFKHPFEHTLYVGDLIIVQGINVGSVEAAYPNSDVLVFHTPKQNPGQEDELKITRVVAKQEVKGVVYFRTKSDGTGTHKWPEIPDVKECDFWTDYRENYTLNGMISEKLLVGKVVFRVPWVGHLVFFVSSFSGMLIVMVLIIFLVIVKFGIPKSKGRKTETEPKKSLEKAFET